MSSTIQDYYDKYASEAKAPHRLNLNFDRVNFTFRTNSKELCDELSSYFQPFVENEKSAEAIEVVAIEEENLNLDLDYTLRPPGPGKTKKKEEYFDFSDGRVIRKIQTGLHFFANDDVNLAVGECCKNPNQIINFINNRFIEYKMHQGHLLFHSSAISSGDRGVAISGMSGKGKSTLCLHAMGEGLTYISNDRVLVGPHDNQLEMLGVPKLPRINPGTIVTNDKLSSMISAEEREKFLSLPKQELWELELKYDVDVEKVYGEGSFKLHAPFNALIILDWNLKGTDSTQVEKLDLATRPDLMPSFMKDNGVYNMHPYKEDVLSEKAYAKLLAGTPLYLVRGKVDFHFMAKRIADYLKGEIKDLNTQ